MSPLSKFINKNVSTTDNNKIRRAITYTDLSPVQEGKVDFILNSSYNHAPYDGWDHYKEESNQSNGNAASVDFFNNSNVEGSFATNAHEWRKKRNFQQRKGCSSNMRDSSSCLSSIQSIYRASHFLPHSRSRLPTLWE